MNQRDRLTANPRISKIKEIIENSHTGKIIKVDDPDFVGRCKIMCYGVYGGQDDTSGSIPVDDIPWAYPMYDIVFGSSSGSGKISTPKMDTLVRVIFEQDIYHPRYIAIEELDSELQAALKDDYTNFHSLLWDSDEKVRVYYSQKKGVTINFDNSIINIKSDDDKTVMIQVNGGKVFHVLKDTISIGKENKSDEPAMLGDTWYNLMDTFITDMGNLTALISPQGPCQAFNTMPGWTAFVAKYKKDFATARSKTVSLDGPKRTDIPPKA